MPWTEASLMAMGIHFYSQKCKLRIYDRVFTWVLIVQEGVNQDAGHLIDWEAVLYLFVFHLLACLNRHCYHIAFQS